MATIIKRNDSMDTIQKKLNCGGEITFEKGLYAITRQLILSANSTINLGGATLQRKASIQSIFLNKVFGSTAGYCGAGGITIKNGTFEGFGAYSADNLVTFFHSHDCRIENCTFLDILCHAVEINACQNFVITKCKFNGCNCSKDSEAYKEVIQIDHAGYASFVLKDTAKTALCYDGTHCKNITIANCSFDRSSYRDYASTCIGTHSQYAGNGFAHENIVIKNNVFKCGGLDKTAPCLSLIGMRAVTVKNNEFHRCGRLARVYSKDYGYDKRGNKVINKGCVWGACRDIVFAYNTFEGSLNDKDKCCGIYVKSNNMAKHEAIKVKDNNFKANPAYKNQTYYLYVDQGTMNGVKSANNEAENLTMMIKV